MKVKLLFASVSIISLICQTAYAAPEAETTTATDTTAATEQTTTTDATSATDTTTATDTAPATETTTTTDTTPATETTTATDATPATETTTATDTSTATEPTTATETTAVTETRTHRNVRKIYPAPRRMGNLTIRPAPIFCLVKSSTFLLRDMTQNVGRALPEPCNPSWLHRIAVSGGINVDLGKFGNRSANYMGENYQHASINDAYINISAVPNDVTTAFFSLSYNNATVNSIYSSTPTSHVAEYDAAYSDNIRGGASSRFLMEQGYVTFANFAATPVYVQIGKQFQDFGRYELHPITEPMTQVMSKTLYTSFKIGFIYKQFSGAAFSFEDPLPKVNHTSRSLNYGFTLNYSHDMPHYPLSVDAGVSWLYNIIAVNDIAYNVNQFNINNPNNLPGGGFNQHISGVALYLDVVRGPLFLNARWTSAVQRFFPQDLPKYGTASIGPDGVPLPNASGAQPWTVGVQLGYGFISCGLPQKIYLGGQGSGQASGLLIPQSRFLAGYSIETVKNTSLGVEWDYDRNYSVANGGNAKNTNMVTLRAAAKFG